MKKIKNFKILIFFFFLMPALIKWSPKVLAMKKTWSQSSLGLKQPKIAEKCHVYGTFRPFLRILMQFSVLDMKWVSCGDIELLTSKYEQKHIKVHWIDLSSPGNGLVIPLIFHVFSQKSQKKKILKKKWSEKLDFWLWCTNTNCFSWYFKLKTWCLNFFFYNRPFFGCSIGPRMQ